MSDMVLQSLVRCRGYIQAYLSDISDDGTLVWCACLLSELPHALFPVKSALLADWDCLREVNHLASAWPSFWRVFWASLADTVSSAPVAVEYEKSPRRPTATAAHPRAYRGTKYQPPKISKPVWNLQLCLSEDRLSDAFFAQHDFAQLPAKNADGFAIDLQVFPEALVSVAALQAYRAQSHLKTVESLPPSFRKGFYWSLRCRPVSVCITWLSLWHAFGSPTEGQTYIALARLCAIEVSAHEWAALALQLDPARQILWLRGVLKHKAYLHPYDIITAEHVLQLAALTDDPARFEIYLAAMLDNLNRQVSPAYTLWGCQIANDDDDLNYLSSRLRAQASCEDLPMPEFERMRTALGNEYSRWRGLSVWEYCGKYSGYAQVLRDTLWDALQPKVAYRWLELFDSFRWSDESESALQQRWRLYRKAFPAWHAGLIATPEPWQEKYAETLASIYSSWEDFASLAASIPILLPIVLRVCQAPYATTSAASRIFASLTEPLSATDWPILAELDQKTWQLIERACRRDNDANLITWGVNVLVRVFPAFTLVALQSAPSGLLRCAHLLGGFNYEHRYQVLRKVMPEAWFKEDWQSIPPLEACRRIYALSQECGIDSPLPRRLHDYLEGRINLKPGQIDRHCRLTLERLVATQLAALEEQIWRYVDAPFKLRDESKSARHAIRYAASIDSNRKGLRRFLRAYSEGSANTAYFDHPLNHAWFARHPHINQSAWQKIGLQIEGEDWVIGHETHPLEILMMGTYVGSCLGLGGICDYSAAACLLDANKQVIYARNKQGGVIARQLLAIDTKDRLVCFEVYPPNLDAKLLRAFRQFDLQLAQSLNLECYSREDDDYEVETILAQHWWDDSAWDGAIREPSQA